MARWCGEEVFQQNDVVDGHGEKWKILHELGSGRCCIAYKVQNVNEPNIVKALKVYHEAENYAACSNTEAYVVKVLKNKGLNVKNIVNVEGKFESRCHQCLLVELLSTTLNQIRQDSSSGVHLYLILRAVYDVLSALVSLHEAGIVHGDIKSNNVMWSAQHSRFKVFDFGLSFNEGQLINHQIQSLFYRAPEASEWNKRLMVERSRRQALTSYFLSQSVGADTAAKTLPSPPDLQPHLPTLRDPVPLSSELNPRISWVSSATGSSSRPVGGDGGGSGDGRLSVIHRTLVSFPTISQRVRSSPDMRVVPISIPDKHIQAHLYVADPAPDLDGTTKKRRVAASVDSAVAGTEGLLWKPVDACHQTLSNDCGGSNSISSRKRGWSDSCASSASVAANTTMSRSLGKPVDLFSVGCLILEMFCGKLESVNFRNITMTGVCSACLVGPTTECNVGRAAYNKILTTPCNEDITPIMIHDLANMVQSLLQCRPEKRLTAKAALRHPFFYHKMHPPLSVLTYLSTCVLRLDDLVDDDQLLYEYAEDYAEIIQEMQERCEKIGPVKIIFIPKDGMGKGKAYIHFTFAHHCERAFIELRGRIFNGRHLQPSFFPIDLWEKQIFI